MFKSLWKCGDARGAAPNDDSEWARDWSLGKAWRLLKAQDQALYLAKHVGLAIAAPAITAVTVASWPLTLPLAWLAMRAADEPGSAGIVPPTLALGAMLAAAPACIPHGYAALGEWARDRARERQKQRHDAALSPADHALLRAAEAGYSVQLTLALAQGADPNAKTNWGSSSVSLACQKNHLGCVKTLIQAGADPDVPDPSGHRPMLWAARNGSVAIGVALVDAGANVYDAKADAKFRYDVDKLIKELGGNLAWVDAVVKRQAERDAQASSPLDLRDNLRSRREAKAAPGTPSGPRSP